MILRKLVWIFLFCNLTGSLCAGFSRGDRLVAEGGGVVGVAGSAAPLNSPSLPTEGAIAGVTGIPAIPGAPGILDFSDFYALMPFNNSLPIAPGDAIAFPYVAVTSSAITAINSTQFLLPVIGTYQVQFQMSITEACQVMLRLNGIELYQTVVGKSALNSQLVGIFMISTPSANSILEVINPAESLNDLTLTTYAGDGTLPASAHLVITRIN